MTVLTSIPNGASGKDVRDTLNDTIIKAATGIANAATNATAITALQSGGLPFYNSGTPISTAGTLPNGVVDQWVFISGTGSYPLPAVPSSGAHSFIVSNIGSGDITVGAITLPTGRSVRLYSRNGSWQQFIDVSAGGAVVAKTLSVAFLQPNQNEGNNPSTVVPFVARFTRTGDTSAAVSFQPTFDAGSTNASDYQGGSLPAPGTLTIAAGATYVDFTINVVGDTTSEPDETATISLPSPLPTGYSAGTATSATMTIVNDDAAQVINYSGVQIEWDGTGGIQQLGDVKLYNGSTVIGSYTAAYDNGNDMESATVGPASLVIDNNPATRFQGHNSPTRISIALSAGIRPTHIGFVQASGQPLAYHPGFGGTNYRVGLLSSAPSSVQALGAGVTVVNNVAVDYSGGEAKVALTYPNGA